MSDRPETAERWEPIKGYPGYSVSDQGRVRGPRRILKPNLYYRAHGKTRPSYARVSLFLRDGTGRKIHVARLVAEAFVGPRPEGQQVNHIDGNKQNNRASNLEWATARENIRHAVEHGLHYPRRGEVSPWSRRTHCKNGHPLVPRPWCPTQRFCPICRKARDAKRPNR